MHVVCAHAWPPLCRRAGWLGACGLLGSGPGVCGITTKCTFMWTLQHSPLRRAAPASKCLGQCHGRQDRRSGSLRAGAGREWCGAGAQCWRAGGCAGGRADRGSAPWLEAAAAHPWGPSGACIKGALRTCLDCIKLELLIRTEHCRCAHALTLLHLGCNHNLKGGRGGSCALKALFLLHLAIRFTLGWRCPTLAHVLLLLPQVSA